MSSHKIFKAKLVLLSVDKTASKLLNLSVKHCEGGRENVKRSVSLQFCMFVVKTLSNLSGSR